MEPIKSPTHNFDETEGSSALNRNFAWLIKEYNVSINKLSRSLGISYGTLYKLMKPKENPTLATIIKIAQYFEVSIDDLIGSDLSTKLKQEHKTQVTKVYFAKVELLEMGIIEIDPAIPPIISNTLRTKHPIFAKKVTGSSLMPQFPNGTTLVFEQHPHPNDGDIVLVKLRSYKSPVERRVLLDGSTYFFAPINKELGNIEKGEDFKILGTMIRAIFDVKS